MHEDELQSEDRDAVVYRNVGDDSRTYKRTIDSVLVRVRKGVRRSNRFSGSLYEEGRYFLVSELGKLKDVIRRLSNDGSA